MHEIVERGIREERNLLEPEALALLQEYGLPVPRRLSGSAIRWF